MTFEEAKAILMDLRAAKRRANAIKRRIEDLQSDYESIQSALGNSGMPHATEIHSRVEALAIKVLQEREKHMAALETYFAIEDKLAEAITFLEPCEQDVIIGCYMDGKENWKVASDLNYSLPTVNRKKQKAIKKIAEILKDDTP